MLTYPHEDARAPEPVLPNPPVTAEEPTSAKGRHSAWRVLRYRDFRSYFLGSLTSNLGTWMQTTAQVVLMYHLTHSVFAVGVVTSAQFAGTLFLGPWAAVVASRIGGRQILIATQLAAAGVAALLAALEATASLGENGLILGALVLGLLFTFALPVQTALVPRLVPENQRDAEAAMAMNSVSYNVGRALAPALSVVVIATIGFTWTFAFNSFSFLVYAVALAVIQPRSPGEPAEPTRVRDGGQIALETPRILLLLAMVAAVTLADDPVLILGPPLAHQLHVSSWWPGYFLSALGLGTVLGSMWPTRGPRSWGKSQTSRRAAGWLLLLAVAVMVFSFGLTTWVSLTAAFAAGVAALGTGAVTQTQLVRLRPKYAASVMALWAICWAGSKPIASLLDGWLASIVPDLWIAAALLALPAVLLAGAEIVLPRKAKDSIRRMAKGQIRGLAVRVGLTPSLEAGFGDDRSPSLMRSELTNGTRATPVSHAATHYRLAHRQLTTHRRSRVSTIGMGSPSHHRPAL
jgi:predicted MFS family arabinose efflux permease